MKPLLKIFRTLILQTIKALAENGGSSCMAHKRAPLNLQWLVLKNSGTNFHPYWFIDSI